MKDHRYVDELSIEELEEAVRIRRRQERLARLNKKTGATDPLKQHTNPSATPVHRSELARTLPFVPPENRYSAEIEQTENKPVLRPLKWRWIGNQVLFLIEILAFVGFIIILIQLLGTLRTINEDSKINFQQPTAVPTPLIGVFVLPGGHTPPDALAQSEPAPVPVHLRDHVAAITPLPVPTPGPEQARRIVIPAIQVDAPVVEGDDWESLKYGSGHHIGSANPGERGNCVISGHNDIYGQLFRDLPDLKVGDEIVIYTASQEYTYVVEQTRIVPPTEVSVLDATSTPVLTLVSCYPYGIDTHRIVVIGSLKSY
ncbi:MAG: class D sortase [Anaerolineae bacterium]|nr:class D sortase [Anaerolineae bacterium]